MKMKPRLEHANLSVRDVDTMVEFLLTAFPEFELRHDARDAGDERWVHVGTAETYIALYQVTAEVEPSRAPYGGQPGVNHLGYEVEDVEALRARLSDAGYRDSSVPNEHPHRRRIYFVDPEGNDWEFVEYTSENPQERNDYSLPS
jgi:catechol 2,3-dioxygenase-like lactoylglutathione lyase family enzyme